jgi:hypothetical protein
MNLKHLHLTLRTWERLPSWAKLIDILLAIALGYLLVGWAF